MVGLLHEVGRLIADGEYHAARRAVQQLEAIPPRMLDNDERELLAFEAGRVELCIGDPSAAEARFSGYLSQYKDCGRWIPSALLNLGLALAQLNRQQEALQAWQEALERRPPLAVRHRLRHACAWALAELGDTRAARAEIAALSAEAEDPEDQLDASLCEAFAALTDRDFRGASATALQIIAAHDAAARQRAHALWIAAEAGCAAGQYVEAGHLAREALRLATNPPRTWLINRVNDLLHRLQGYERGVS